MCLPSTSTSCVRWTSGHCHCLAVKCATRRIGGWSPRRCQSSDSRLVRNIMEKFVCAFRGRRDAYQAPLALSEGNLLETFITDAYATPMARVLAPVLPRVSRDRLKLRREPSIPDEQVCCLWGTALLEK